MAVGFRLPVAAVLALSIAAACNSPTLPLPPPSVSALTYENDQVTVEGNAIAGAMVFAYNQTGGEGAIYKAEDDGYYFMVIPGQPDDVIAIWQQDGDDSSPTIERLVPRPDPPP